VDRLRRGLRRAGCAQGLGQGLCGCPRWPRWAPQRDPRVSDTTAGLVLLGDWLAGHQVQVVGMESTGVCWKPV
jgi:hypothetical protein